MPWKIVRSDSRCSEPFAVVKVGDNKLQGCHKTRERAKRQLAALNASEEKTMENKGTQHIEMQDELDQELEDRVKANEFANKGGQIGKRPERETLLVGTSEADRGATGFVEPMDKKEKMREKFMGDMPWTPFESFEEMEAAEEAQDKAREISRAAEVIPSMINNVIHNNEPEEVEKKTKNIFVGFLNRLKSVFSTNAKEKQPEPVTDEKQDQSDENIGTFMIFKGEDDQLLWLSSYSNNIRDNDQPPEIISSKSHKTFVGKVDKGEEDLPELWLWHEKDWKLGEATVVAYDEDNGAAIAAGFFYKEAEAIATAIQENEIDWGVSHGMPSMRVKRSAEDPTVIIEHVTKEISPLPHFAAANKFAGFVVLKEANMAVKDEKRSSLKEAGIPEDALDSLDAMNKAKSDVADELELDRKEKDTEPKQEDAAEKQEDQPVDEKEEPMFSEAQLKELSSTFKAFGEKLVEELPAVVKSIVQEEMKPLIEEQKAIKEADAQEILQSSPRASLLEMLTNGGPLLKGQSATDADETKVDGRTKLAKSGPEESDSDDEGFGLTSLIKDITTGDFKNYGSV